MKKENVIEEYENALISGNLDKMEKLEKTAARQGYLDELRFLGFLHTSKKDVEDPGNLLEKEKENTKNLIENLKAQKNPLETPSSVVKMTIALAALVIFLGGVLTGKVLYGEKDIKKFGKSSVKIKDEYTKNNYRLRNRDYIEQLRDSI